MQKIKKLKTKLKQKNNSNDLLWILAVYFLILIYQIFVNAMEGFYLIIPLVLFVVFYLSYRISNKYYSKSELISSIIFLLVLALGPFGIYEYSFFGVTGDVYLHLLAGYFVTRWIINSLISLEVKRTRLIAFFLMVFFSVGVEVYEYFMAYLMSPEDLNQAYLQDTMNDFFNDFIGILLGLIRNEKI